MSGWPLYPVVWRIGGGPSRAGRLELRDDALLFDAAGAQDGAALRIELAELESVRIGRRPDERLDGVRSIVLERRTGERVLAYVAVGIGALTELADTLARMLPGTA